MLHKPIKKAWLLYVCLLTLFAGCSKCNKTISPNDASSLPAATETGAGTFGCMLNGQPWTPVGQQLFIYPRNPTIIYDPTYNGGTLRLSAYISTDRKDLMQTLNIICDSNFSSIGEYNLTNSKVSFDYTNLNGSSEDNFCSCEDVASNCKLIITKLDRTNKIMSGTFSFTLQKKETGKKVTITDGRFDMKFL